VLPRHTAVVCKSESEFPLVFHWSFAEGAHMRPDQRPRIVAKANEQPGEFTHSPLKNML
jgi:hypothetical protein